MVTATEPATGRRYRGLSAEERRADQRERLVRAAINEFAARGYHRTSVEDIVRSARTSRTAFYAFFDNREAAMYGALQASLRGLLDAVRKRHARRRPRHEPHRGRRHRVRRATSSSDPGRGADPAARGHRHVARGERAAQPRPPRGRRRVVRDIWAEYDPEAAASPQASAVAVGVFGLLLESMLHLVESDRLDEAPAHVPALVTAVERMLAPAAD